MDDCLEELYLDLCRTWLYRAQNSPLSICLDTDGLVPVDHPLLDLVCELSHQWLDIELGSDIPLSRLPVNQKYPWLEKLWISAPLTDRLTLNFHAAPRLRDVFILEYTPKIQLPCHQLIKFRTNNIEIWDCPELLRQALEPCGSPP
ncbi:hypothetical protein MSAN_01048200 [Mycena sanguinolenta]|uniref:Uncharacterized protein n=1 Tax=Mycena sanguinolenta TaxID=230812 RepID=A0A8H6YRL5_9AGAR|nr:hypothetical protein MSAN_01048200 [Mycena sanguinolenta]